jgi:hypothetical protein
MRHKQKSTRGIGKSEEGREKRQCKEINQNSKKTCSSQLTTCNNKRERQHHTSADLEGEAIGWLRASG